MSTHNQHAQTLWSYYGPLIDAGAINEIKMPTSIMRHIGIEGLAFIGQRFSEKHELSTRILYDENRGAIRIMPFHDINGSPNAPTNDDREVKSRKKGKTPRPPNAFILYRQCHHPLLMKKNPGLHNNEISVLLGKQWSEESIEAKEYYKQMAEDRKKEHLRENPDYQYRPRKPTEKKRRMTKRKAAALAKLRDDYPSKGTYKLGDNGDKQDLSAVNEEPQFLPSTGDQTMLSNGLTYAVDSSFTDGVDMDSDFMGTIDNTASVHDHLDHDMNSQKATNVESIDGINTDAQVAEAPTGIEYTKAGNAVLTLGDDTMEQYNFEAMVNEFNSNAAAMPMPNFDGPLLGPILSTSLSATAQQDYNFYSSIEDPFKLSATLDTFDYSVADETLDDLAENMPEMEVLDEFENDIASMTDLEFERIIEQPYEETLEGFLL